jgi:Domain of unknown function (DUF222)
MFGVVETAIAELETIDPSALSPTELADGIKALSGFTNRLQGIRARWIEAFDRDHLYAQSGDTSTTSWLRNNCQMSGGSADSQVQLARQLPQLEATQKALASGEIGIEHAVEIARATKDLGAGAEGELLAAARAKDPVELRETAREIRHRVDPDQFGDWLKSTIGGGASASTTCSTA